MGPYAGVDYNLTLCLLQSRLQHMYHGQPYAKVDLNPMLESAVSPSQGVKIWPLIFIVNVRLTRRFLKNHVNIKFDLLKLLRQVLYSTLANVLYVTDGNIMYLTDASRSLISCVIQHYAPVMGWGGGGTDA